MSNRMTANVPIYFDSHSDNAATGRGAAVDFFMEQNNGLTPEQAALQITEFVMDAVLSESMAGATAVVYGVIHQLVEFAGKPQGVTA